MANRDDVKPRILHPLIPTNVPGAFASPPLPEGFDVRTASAASLVRNGLLWRRPAPGDPPAVQAAWNRVFSRTWRPEDRIVPHLEPQIGVTHNLKKPLKRVDTSYVGGQWAGAVIQGPWTGVIGFWVIPNVTIPTEPQGAEGGWNSSSWIGLDGMNGPGYTGSDDVLQAGVQQRIDGAGNVSYVAWYEWFAPQQSGSPPYIFQTNITNFPVSPGQTVYCSAQYVGQNGYLYFANDTTGQHFSITLNPPPGATFSGNSAEWIMEAPDGGETNASLPRFTPVQFSTALCCGVNNVGNPATGDTISISGFGRTLTSATLGTNSATIDYVPLSSTATFNQVTFTILTGGDDLRGDSSATASIQFAGGSQTFTLKAQSDAGWGNNSTHTKTFSIAGPPVLLSAFGTITITLTSHDGLFETPDNWNIQSLSVSASGSSGVAEVFSGSGNPLARLTGSAPSVTVH
jgi:hypothetical protein